MKKSLLISCTSMAIMFIIIGQINFVFASHIFANTIDWEENKKIVWDDFDGNYTKFPEAKNPNTIAWTDGNFYVWWDFVDVPSTICQYQITKIDTLSYFNKTRSWVKPGYESDFTLNHEQGHFDIIEVKAREFRAGALNKIFECPSKEFSRDEINEAILKNVKQFDSQGMQDKYDMMTKNGTDPRMQQFWDFEIDILLKRYRITNSTIIEPQQNPLQQIKTGIDPQDIECKTGWKRVVKINKEFSACTTPAIASKLEERGWGTIVGPLR